jgi:hypothetical protein
MRFGHSPEPFLPLGCEGEQAKAFVAACLAGDPSATLSPLREAAKEIAFAYDLVKSRRG